MKNDKKTRWFFRIRDAYIARSAILMVKRNQRVSVGKDGVERVWVVTLCAETSSDPRYRSIWASEEEIAPLLEMLEEECGKIKRSAFVPAAPAPQEAAALPEEF